MIDNQSAILLMFGFLIFLYYFKEYFKTRFQEIIKDKNRSKLSEEFDLFFIIGSFVSVLFFTIILMQDNPVTQNNILSGWFAFIITLFTPCILLFLVVFVMKLIKMIKTKQEVKEHYDK